MSKQELEITGKCIIFSAPSGSGKTTIVHALLDRIEALAFSISACSRPPRGKEEDEKDYYFLSIDDFKQKIKNDEFIEWEEVYENNFYGTLKSEVQRLWKKGKIVIFDVDVYGGLTLKKFFGENAMSFFIKAPSIEELGKRLRQRQTETEDKIQMRLQKAEEELNMKYEFDQIITNDILERAIHETEEMVRKFIGEVK